MYNTQMWRSALAARKIFEDNFDTNDFTSLMMKSNPGLSGVALSKEINDERSIFEDNVLAITNAYGQGGLDSVRDMIYSYDAEVEVLVSVFDTLKVDPEKIRSYLDSHYILDDSEEFTDGNLVFSLDVNYRINLLEPKFDGLNHDYAWARDVVMSPDLKFVTDRIDDAIELLAKNCVQDFEHGGCPDIIEIRRGNTILFEVPLKHSIFGITASGEMSTPDFNKLKVVDAKLKDIKVLESQMTHAQTRRARGQLLTTELGM